MGILLSGCKSSEIPGWKQLNSVMDGGSAAVPTRAPTPKTPLQQQAAAQTSHPKVASHPTVAVETAPQPAPPPPPAIIMRPPSTSMPPPNTRNTFTNTDVPPGYNAPSSPSTPEVNKGPSFVPLLTRSTGTIDARTIEEGPSYQNQSPPPPPPAEGAVRVALLLPLSGPNAAVGKAMLNAAQLAIFAFAADGLELLPQDTKGTPEGAVEAAALAIGDGAELILGPLLSASVKAVSPHARAANVPVLGFSSDRTVAGLGTYTMGFLPSAEVDRIITYAHGKGYQRFAALVPDNDYGTAIISALELVADQLGVAVTRVKYYDPLAEDYTSVVRELANYGSRRGALVYQRKELKARGDEIAQRALKRLQKRQTLGNLPFDALLLPAGGKRLQAIAALLPFFDIDPSKIKMLGTGQWDASRLGAEPALLGGWFAAPPPTARTDFMRQYKEMYGQDPHRLATLAYDAGALAAVLARAKDGPNFSEEAITAGSGFAGRDGIFRFLPQGVAERGLAVLQLTHRGSKVIDEAPASFDPPLN